MPPATDEQAVAVCVCVFVLNMSSVWHIPRRACIMLAALGCQSLSHPMGKIRRCPGRVGVGVNCSWGPTPPPLAPADIKSGE